jgi:Arf-GAP with coiled-coil, ANK repeat and PH domain-containing protein
VDKLFVKQLEVQQRSRPGNAAVRKWSVRKLRRRPRSQDGHIKSGSRPRVPKLRPTTEEPSSGAIGGEPIEKADFEASEKAEVLLFGHNLDEKQTMEEPIDLSSGEDSTAGDDDSEIAQEEDISTLHPDRLLYRAAQAHNLPVMCEALALGADKFWINTEDNARSAIHQAVLSVSELNGYIYDMLI